MRGTTFPTRRLFYDFGADRESDICRQLIHERVRRAAAAALAELRARQQQERNGDPDGVRVPSE
jgi:hypothetical protein